MDKKYMRQHEAAEYLGIAESTLSKMRLRDYGPPYSKAGPRLVLYRVSDLDAWVEGGLRHSTKDSA